MSLEKEIIKDENDKKPNNQKSGGKLRYIINISIVLILTVVSLAVNLWGDKFTAVTNLFNNCDWTFILIVVVLVFASILTNGLILFCFARLYKRKYYYHQALAVEQIGTFYNAVTPGSSGGQIMEAYTFKKQGVPISSAVSIMATCSIVYQIVLIIYGLISFIVKYDFINQIGAIDFKIADLQFSLPIWLLTIIGFLLNLGFIGIIFLMSYWRGFHHFITGPCVSFASKIHLCKNPNKTRENLRIQVENFKMELRRLLTNIPFFILVSVLFFVYLTLRFSIPYFCGLALHNQSTNANFWDAVFLSNYHQMVTGLIPIPGSAGISEYFFSKLFCSNSNTIQGFYALFDSSGMVDVVASQGLTSACLLLWRTMTFTLPLIIAGIVSAFYHSSPKDVIVKEDKMPNRQTFISLQNETYVERSREVETIVQTNVLSRKAVLDKLKLSSLKNKTNKNKTKKKQAKDDSFDEIKIDEED